MSSLPQYRPSVAFQFGARDAQAGLPCVPEMVFVNRKQQIEYCHGYESISGATSTTAQFTGSKLPQPPASKRTEAATYPRIVEAIEARGKRLDAMLAKTALLSPEHAGDILWAV